MRDKVRSGQVKMNVNLKTMWLVLPWGMLALGCQAPVAPEGPTVSRVTAQSPGDVDELYDSVNDVLRGYYFELDRQDRVEGIITTHPETSAAAGELWRPQAVDPYYWVEDNTHTTQRQATVKINPADVDGEYTLDVQIDRYRYRLEERQITNSAAALRLYGGGAPTYQGDNAAAWETAYWIPLGRDESMEKQMLALILKQYETRSAAAQPAPPDALTPPDVSSQGEEASPQPVQPEAGTPETERSEIEFTLPPKN